MTTESTYPSKSSTSLGHRTTDSLKSTISISTESTDPSKSTTFVTKGRAHSSNSTTSVTTEMTDILRLVKESLMDTIMQILLQHLPFYLPLNQLKTTVHFNESSKHTSGVKIVSKKSTNSSSLVEKTTQSPQHMTTNPSLTETTTSFINSGNVSIISS